MLIDMHLHQDRHSFDSHVSLEEIIEEAKAKGLDGICITDHDNMDLKRIVEDFYDEDLKIFVGTEVLTSQGDILVLGLDLDQMPQYDPDDASSLWTPDQLLKLVHEAGGIAISAHPYRNNNRGLGDHIYDHGSESEFPLSAVEVLNGSTPYDKNLLAKLAARDNLLGMTGGSDAHKKERVGLMATYFPYEIETEAELIQAVKDRDCEPVYYENGTYHRFVTKEEKTA